MEVIVNLGNATDTDVYGPGPVVTAYPIEGNFVKKIWHGSKQPISIVPWWINVGQYRVQ